jgi:hypothetical protein
MVAGIAGIVVFMDFLQLLIAFILKVRERRWSHLVHPTAPLRNNFSVFATIPCRGLSLSR